MSRPDPVELARRLLDMELTSELDGFHRAAATYAELLGDAGLAEYRRLLESPAVSDEDFADEDDADRSWSRGFALRHARIGWAIGTGDPDLLIEVKRHDLHLPDDFLEVARMLADAGRVVEAVDWARRGLAEPDDRSWQLAGLRDFLSELLRSQGNVDASIDLFWSAFVTSPSLAAYRRLLAELPDTADEWRGRCVEELRGRVAAQSEAEPSDPVRHARVRPSDVLIEVLMFDGKTDPAWEVAREHGCDSRKLLALAQSREGDHPVDAIDVYEPEVFSLIDQKKNYAYSAAVDLMTRIERLATAAGCPERFDDVLLRARTEHRAKRNLKKLLDAKKWADPRTVQ